jgi:glycine cleavage system aminomethyltransferase T
MRSAPHRSHAGLGAEFETRGAWMVPATYGAQDRETEAMKSGLGFADVSARGKLHLAGAVEPSVRSLTGISLDPGHTAPVASGGLVARVARDWALALLRPADEEAALKSLGAVPSSAVSVTDVTSAMSGFLAGGPRLPEFLAQTLTIDVGGLQAGRCVAASWARIPAVLLMRDLGTPAVELYVGSEYGRYAWDTLQELGRTLGGAPVGWRVLESLGWS